MLIGGAFLGSAAMLGSAVLPTFSKVFSESSFSPRATFASSGTSYPSAGVTLPTPANTPSLLYVGSCQDGTSSLQLATIAGILARTTPVIYLSSDSFVDGNVEQSLSSHYGVTFDKSNSTSDLISKFGAQACGSPARWIKYESGYDMKSTLGQNEAVDQLNAVRTLCGVYNAIPVPAGESCPISAQSSPLYDISTWGVGVNLYQRVWNLVSGSVTKNWLAINPPAGSTLRLQMTDYMVMSKAFSFQVPLKQLSSAYTSAQDQKNFAATVINSYATPYAVLGYVGIGEPGGGSNEIDFVAALSGGSSATSSALSGSSPKAQGGGYYSGAQQTANMTVKSAFAPYSGASFPNPASGPGYDSGKKYITLIASQGDVLDWVESQIANYMLECQSAGMPIGLTFTQVTQWLDPPIFHWFVDNIGSNSGVVTSGSAGMGYAHMTELPNMSQCLTTAANLSGVSNIKDFFFIDGPGVNPLADGDSVANKYISGLEGGGATPRALWWWSPVGVAPSVVNGVPCFFAALSISETNTSTQAGCDTMIRNAVKSAKSNFIVLFLNTTWPKPAYLKSACSSNGCTPLSPGTFANLYRSSKGLSPV